MDRPVTMYGLCDERGAVWYVGHTRQVELRRAPQRKRWPHQTLIALAVVPEEQADVVERHWIEHYRAQGRKRLVRPRLDTPWPGWVPLGFWLPGGCHIRAWPHVRGRGEWLGRRPSEAAPAPTGPWLTDDSHHSMQGRSGALMPAPGWRALIVRPIMSNYSNLIGLPAAVMR